MKKRKSFFLALAAMAMGLVSCGLAPANSGSGDTVTPSASGSAPADSSADSSASASFIDYANDGSVKLGLDYAGHTFLRDGVEKAEVRKSGSNYVGFIDGDTAHFLTASGDIIKARFFGVDTPESTGKVQPWGKEASNYTKEKLKEADQNGTIVISSPQDTYAAPEPDSTGTRYVTLVWVNLTKKNAAYNELTLLNLMIVQDGYSWVKNVGDMPAYESTFYAAQEQAKVMELNLFSGEIPDSFNDGDYIDVSILDIKNEVTACIDDPTHKNAYDNVRVRVYGTVAGFSNKILYLQDYVKKYDAEGKETGEGEFAGINIFVGMSAIPSKFTNIGTYISVAGLAQDSDNFGFQITDTNFPRVSYDPVADSQVLLTADQNTDEHALQTFEYTSSQINALVTNKNYESLFCNIKITDPLTVTGGYDGDSNTITLQFGREYKFDVYVTFMVYPDPANPAVSWNSYEYFVNKQVYISGVFVARKTTSGKWVFQVNPSSNNDLVVVM